MDFSRYIGILSCLSMAGVSHVAWASHPPLQIAQDPGQQYSCYVQLPNGQVENLSRWCGALTPQPTPPPASQPETPASSNGNTNNGNPPNNSTVPGQTSAFPGKPQPNPANQAQPPAQGTNALPGTQDTTDDTSEEEGS